MTDLLDPAKVVVELLVLRRQRSLHSVDLAALDLPLLGELLQLDDVDPSARRTHLFEELTRAAETLPAPESTILLIAYGITDQAPLLKDRLIHAGEVIQRDSRTVRRRLDKAELLLAQALIDRYVGKDDGGGAPHGWFIAEYETRLDLRSRPLFVSRRLVRVTAPRLRVLVESVSVPRVAEAEPEFAALEGASVIDVSRMSASVFRVTYELDREVSAGEEYQFVSSVRFGGRAQMRAMSIMLPIRPCRRYICEVLFGSPPAAVRVWRLNGVPATALDDRPTRGAVGVTASMRVREEFAYLRPGLAYGVRWEWADGPGQLTGAVESADLAKR